ncbi:DUF5324 family protein [Streptomyces sp. NPDC056367]|uniref:DUF5324 family protein n=1 Tax=unclassified Streptomyces TaxID=2593676 RepID=UPI0035D697E5
MTRKDMHLAAEHAREAVKYAAEAVAPYAGSARDAAVQYAHDANELLAPKVSSAAHGAARQARSTYECHVQPRIRAARTHVPPNVDRAATRAVEQTRLAARQAAEYTQPRIESAIAAATPMAEEAASRSVATWAALRGQVSAEEVQKLVRRHERRACAGKWVKGFVIAGVVAIGAFAAWRWWDQQANPDWLVEPPAATELSASDAEPASFDDELAEKERDAGSSFDDKQI